MEILDQSMCFIGPFLYLVEWSCHTSKSGALEFHVINSTVTWMSQSIRTWHSQSITIKPKSISIKERKYKTTINYFNDKVQSLA